MRLELKGKPMTSKLKCPWCDREMMYSVLGQNLTSSHFCDNVDCKAFQMVLPDNLWKDIFAWKQSQKDLEIARKALEDIVLEHNANAHGRYVVKIAEDALKQIHALDQKEEK